MRWRLVIIAVLIVLALAAFTSMLLHPTGQQLLHSPQQAGLHVRQWTLAHPIAAEVAIIIAYVLFTLIAMPVWWINVLAGYSFGLVGGTVRCVIASGIAAAVTAHLWSFLAGDLAHSGKITRYRVIRVLESYAKQYGFLVVLLTRLMHLLPFGLSNYIFGMLEIRWTRVLAGTLLGSVPSVAIYVALGTGTDWTRHRPLIIAAGVLVVAGFAIGAYQLARHTKHLRQ